MLAVKLNQISFNKMNTTSFKSNSSELTEADLEVLINEAASSGERPRKKINLTPRFPQTSAPDANALTQDELNALFTSSSARLSSGTIKKYRKTILAEQFKLSMIGEEDFVSDFYINQMSDSEKRIPLFSKEYSGKHYSELFVIGGNLYDAIYAKLSKMRLKEFIDKLVLHFNKQIDSEMANAKQNGAEVAVNHQSILEDKVMSWLANKLASLHHYNECVDTTTKNVLERYGITE